MIISQMINTIQGEGPKLGVPSLLIRVGGCNLCCTFCDTKYAVDVPSQISQFDIEKNNTPPYKLNSDGDIDNFVNYIIKHQRFNRELNSLNMHNIMFTGGEPLLQLNNIINIINRINNYITSFDTYEIETNGLLINEDKLINIIKCIGINKIQINLSPKLDPNCFKQKMKDDDIINAYINVIKIIDKYQQAFQLPFTYFKLLFDTENESNNNNVFILIDRILNETQSITKNQIYLMPITSNVINDNMINDYRTRCLKTVDTCMRLGINFAVREHLFLFRGDVNENIRSGVD